MNLPAASDSSASSDYDSYGALRFGNFRLYLIGSVIANIGLQMQTVAVGWEIYDRTDSKPALGLVGLVQVLPALLLPLLTGHVADRVSRQSVIVVSMFVAAIGSFCLALISITVAPIPMIYVCLLGIAIARAFHQPAKAALLPQLVPAPVFSNAVSWGMSGFQLSSVLGPAIGGLLIFAFQRPAIVYGLSGVCSLSYVAMMLLMRGVPRVRSTASVTLAALSAGFSFVWRQPVILAALALDLFAVLLGGAVTLTPVFARDILNVGPKGLGLLDASPALGAILMALWLAHRPPLRHAGFALLSAVAGFGIATIVFGLSKSFELSLFAFFLAGAFDNVSVVVRHTLVQVLTPDEMRGRVSAVNSMFIGASNELGGFESAMVAYFFTPEISVVAGGVGTLLVVGLIAIVCPPLRRYGRLDAMPAADSEAAPRSLQHPATAAQPPELLDTEPTGIET